MRSSLADVPERKGPFWLAGLAAALIAAIVVGLLVVANLNRNPTGLVPGALPTPSPSASPTRDSSLPVFGCTSSGAIIDYAQAPTPADIDAIRAGTHPGYDRVTIEFKSGQLAGYQVNPQSGTNFTQGASGQAVRLAGANGILIILNGADLHTAYTGPTDIKTGYAGLVEIRQVEDFEGIVQLAVGVSGATCYRAFILSSPLRFIIDIQTP